MKSRTILRFVLVAIVVTECIFGQDGEPDKDPCCKNRAAVEFMLPVFGHRLSIEIGPASYLERSYSQLSSFMNFTNIPIWVGYNDDTQIYFRTGLGGGGMRDTLDTYTDLLWQIGFGIRSYNMIFESNYSMNLNVFEENLRMKQLMLMMGFVVPIDIVGMRIRPKLGFVIKNF